MNKELQGMLDGFRPAYEEMSDEKLFKKLNENERRLRPFFEKRIPSKWKKWKDLDRTSKAFDSIKLSQVELDERDRLWRDHESDFDVFTRILAECAVVIGVLSDQRKAKVALGKFTRRGLEIKARERRETVARVVEQLIAEGIGRNQGYKEILGNLDGQPEELQQCRRFQNWYAKYGTASWIEVGRNPQSRVLFQKWMSDVKRKRGL